MSHVLRILFALCDGLGASCEWDGTAGTAAATYCGKTMTFTLGSNLVRWDAEDWEPWEMHAAPVYQDGELWVDASICVRSYRDVELIAATKNSWDDDFKDGWTDWVVIPYSQHT